MSNTRAVSLRRLLPLLLIFTITKISTTSEVLINIGVQTQVLNSTYCSLQPESSSFVAHYIGMREVKRDAFSQCFNLITIDLMMNELTYIDKDTLVGQRKLETLNLIGNKIQQLHKDVFVDLIHLKQLFFGYNRLKKFSPSIIRNLHSLDTLRLQANNFTSFNVEKVIERVPLLRRISFDNGRFNCEELFETVQYLEERGIEVEHYHVDILPRDAIIKDERICIPDTDEINNNKISKESETLNVTLFYDILATLNVRLMQQEVELQELKAELQERSMRILDNFASWGTEVSKKLKEQSVVQSHVLALVQNITATNAEKQIHVENLTSTERKCLKTRYSNLYK